MTQSETVDPRYMATALTLARRAWQEGDWPVGAVICRGGTLIAEGRGRQCSANDPTAHAEKDALRRARAAENDVTGATIYCTMEPCPMCAHALYLHGITGIVLGARHADLGRSDLGHYSLERFCDMMGYQFQITGDVMRKECVELRRAWGQDPA
ncbi:nucleoside deaminase [Oceanibium sediminis]|uniref:nucleoside deaminase n=1 Tax=Oceanibium sediminis TaxID=2026339 RepID=UPI000DD444D7|nr:nucleoside deaminase [Oceanibium sediminis]